MVGVSERQGLSDLVSYEKVVVDAGPLMSILVLKYAFTLEPGAAMAKIAQSRVASYLRDDSAQRAMVRLFDHVRSIATTSHVIGELQGLQQLKGDSQTTFWEASMNWLASKGLEETLISLMELHSHPGRRGWVCEIGPTDSGLIELAVRHRTVLLTDDRRTMLARARQNGVDCRVVHDELHFYC
ncbi:MAG TPA: hypothetical protein VGK48_06310 [Terriglobia bacterium]|jgi:rRNA-processing protein FCF1